MNTLTHLAITYFCIGVLLATVMGGSKLINEYKQGTIRSLNKKEFVLMLVALLLMWPLLFVEILGD